MIIKDIARVERVSSGAVVGDRVDIDILEWKVESFKILLVVNESLIIAHHDIEHKEGCFIKS